MEVLEPESPETFELERVQFFKEEVPVVENVAAQEEPVQDKFLLEEIQRNGLTQEEFIREEEKFVNERMKEVNALSRNNALSQKLSGLRRELAKAESVAPYLIFHDKTLWGMVENMPGDLSALGKISGVGKSKLEKYGNTFLSALREGVNCA